MKIYTSPEVEVIKILTEEELLEGGANTGTGNGSQNEERGGD